MLRAVGPELRIPSWRAARGLHLLMALCAALGALETARAAADEDPFEPRVHDGLGAVVQAWPLSVSRCPGPESDLLVLSTEGTAPSARKRVTWMPCGSALQPGDPRIVQRELGPEVVLVDVARLPGREGPQLLEVSAAGIRARGLGADDRQPALTWKAPRGLPLAPRPRRPSRVPIVDDWHANGRPVALVPALEGGWLVDLARGEARALPMPVFAEYMTWEPFLPRTIWSWMIAETRWPTLARADDDGDGRLDLFVLSRWQIWVYRAGARGLPARPSRRLDFVPFDAETERRHQATGFSYFATDLNADDRADLVLSTLGGGLMRGRSTTRIHLNPGDGVTLDGPPTARRETEGGFAGVLLVDLDGDGRREILETAIEFGVLQLVGALLTGKAEISLRVLSVDPGEPGGTRTLFEDELAFRLDLGESRVVGLVPTLGDWNGDGLQDLYVAKGSDAIAFRLGAAGEKGLRFERATGRQPLPLESGEGRVGDLDGDGLDEIIAFQWNEPGVPLVVLHNLGRLPGTGPTLRRQANGGG